MTEKQQEAKQLFEKHGTIAGAANEAGICPAAMRKRLRGIGMFPGVQHRDGTCDTTASVTVNHSLTAHSLVDFRNAYDKDTIIPRKIREALESIGSGWVYESELTRISGVGYADLGMYRDEFADHVVFIKRESKRAWTGSTETAEAMRKML